MERYHIFKLGLAILFYAAYCIRPMVVNGQKIDDQVDENQPKKFNENDLIFYQGVQGKPGVDFPVLSHIPRTSFNCRKVDSGYYADLETDCQVFHICEDNKKISFLCPNGTIFQQSELICEWWFKVNCTDSPNLYEESAEQLREDNARRKLSRKVQNHGAVMRTEERSSVSIKNNRNHDDFSSKKASKRVFSDDRINNHATNYRDNFEQNNDLSKSSSSDFVRDRNFQQPTPFKKTNNEEIDRNPKQNHRGRKPVQFQQAPTVDNDEVKERKTTPNRVTLRRKPVVKNSERNYQEQSEDTQKNYNPRQFNKHSGTRNQEQSEDTQKNYNPRQFNKHSGTRKPVQSNDDNGTNFNDRRQKSNQNRNRYQFRSNSARQSTSSTNGDFQKSTTSSPRQDDRQDFNPHVEEKFSNNFESNQRQEHEQPLDSGIGFAFSDQQFSTTTERHINFNEPRPFSSQNQQSTSDHFDHSQPEIQQDLSFGNHQNGFSTSAPTTAHFSDDSKHQTSFKHNAFGSNGDKEPQTYDQNNDFNLKNNQHDSRHQTSFKHNAFGSNGDKEPQTYEQNNNFNLKNNQQEEQDRNNNFDKQDLNENRENSGFYREDNKKFTSSSSSTNFQKTQTSSFASSTQTPDPVPLRADIYDHSQTFGNINTFSTAFPNNKQHTKNLNFDVKESTEKSTVPLTRNDLVNRRLETGDSDEAQITQETASFYKNSFNRIDHTQKSTLNPHPNHRETYSELKEPKVYSTKSYSAISSVTPHYLTTQAINKGQPFVGSQVGTTLKNNQNSATRSNNYFTTLAPTTVGKTGRTFTTFTTENSATTTGLFNVGRTDKSLTLVPLSTQSTFTPGPVPNITVPSRGSFNIGVTSTLKPKTESSTGRIIDHATVYGKFVKSGATTPSESSSSVSTTRKLVSSTTPISSSRTRISLSKSLFGSNVTPSPQQVNLLSTTQPSGRTRISLSKSLFGGNSNAGKPTPFTPGTTKTSAEILSASDSFNRGIPQVRFFGKVQTTTTIPGVEIHFNGNSVTSKTISSGFNAISTTPKPRGRITFGTSSTAIPLSVNSLSSFDSNTISTTPPTTTSPFFSTTNRPEYNSVTSFTGSTFDSEFNSVTPTNYFVTTTSTPEYNSVTPSTDFDSSTTHRPYATTYRPLSRATGFFVTRNGGNLPTEKSLTGEIVRPRPFQLPPDPDFSANPVYTSTTREHKSTPNPTYPTYKISSASPFAGPQTPEPTLPTPFTTATPTLPSTFENVDSMINALAEMATHNNFSNDNPRPGLIIPPSAGPQTLHTLAVYFANALDGIASDKEEEGDEAEEDEDMLTKIELEKKKLTELLTQMTMERYNELFVEDKENEETTTIASRIKEDDDNDLEGQNSKGPAQATPKVRQLAKVFTQALSSYLDDPVTFKKVLEEVRPTEPPDVDDITDFGDDELLNFSDADSKSSFPPFFPTPPAVRPTWGYLIAYNTSQNLDVKNSINPDLENLQGADSQSFVSQFNKLHNANKEDKEVTTKSSLQLPDNHWTTSPNVNQLWKTAFTFDPASINENFGTTEATITTTEEATEEPEEVKHHHEIKYELRALPQLDLNSTQVHGILIDFMNTTRMDDSNRLQRILKKLNTTEDEFLDKMKEIEKSPLTRRLILLLINECGNNTQQVNAQAFPIHSLLTRSSNTTGIINISSSVADLSSRGQESKNNLNLQVIDPALADDSQDARALQLLNSLYTIASRFGK